MGYDDYTHCKECDKKIDLDDAINVDVDPDDHCGDYMCKPCHSDDTGLQKERLLFKGILYTGENLKEVLEKLPSIIDHYIEVVTHDTFRHSFKIETLFYKTAVNRGCAIEGDFLVLLKSGAVEPIHHELLTERDND